MKIYDSGANLTSNDLLEYEKQLNLKFPEDYRLFMINHNGGKTEKDMYMQKSITFIEKLKIISEIYLNKHELSFSENEFMSIENNLQTKLPIPLREFYLMFGGNLDLLKCMYNIATPRELYIENNILMLAKENQNVCGYGINIDTQKIIYFDSSNNILETVNQNIEDFLIYLLAIQGTEYFHCVGKISTDSVVELERYLIRISKADGEGAVFCSTSGIIGFVVGNDIFLSAKNDDCMGELENESGLEIDFF